MPARTMPAGGSSTPSRTATAARTAATPAAPRPDGTELPSPATGPNPTHLRARRSPRLMAAGLMLACLGGLGGAMAYQQASHSNQVVVVQRAVPRGQTVQSSDLGVVTIGPAPGVHTVPGDQLRTLVGKEALVDLPAGSLVGAESVGVSSLPAGHTQVGLKLAAGRVPVEAMPAGTPVQLVQVSTDKQAGQLVVDAVVVTSPSTMNDGSTQVLDVALPEKSARAVADLAARDLLVLVRRAG